MTFGKQSLFVVFVPQTEVGSVQTENALNTLLYREDSDFHSVFAKLNILCTENVYCS